MGALKPWHISDSRGRAGPALRRQAAPGRGALAGSVAADHQGGDQGPGRRRRRSRREGRAAVRPSAGCSPTEIQQPGTSRRRRGSAAAVRRPGAAHQRTLIRGRGALACSRKNKGPSKFEAAADGSMTLMEHVRELRNRLFWASLGILGRPDRRVHRLRLGLRPSSRARTARSTARGSSTPRARGSATSSSSASADRLHPPAQDRAVGRADRRRPGLAVTSCGPSSRPVCTGTSASGRTSSSRSRRRCSSAAPSLAYVVVDKSLAFIHGGRRPRHHHPARGDGVHRLRHEHDPAVRGGVRVPAGAADAQLHRGGQRAPAAELVAGRSSSSRSRSPRSPPRTPARSA